MITVCVFKNKDGVIYGFEAENHGKDIVCAAVSMLTTNLVNSIETFTDEQFEMEHDEKGGFMRLILPNIKDGSLNNNVNLLFNSFELGLKSVKESHNKQIKLYYK